MKKKFEEKYQPLLKFFKEKGLKEKDAIVFSERVSYFRCNNYIKINNRGATNIYYL